MPDDRAVQEALARIVTSGGFANSPRMSRFLRFVVEETMAGRASSLKEYAVGVHVFDKAESYDPAVDPTVRVEASKLRGKLARYYESEGREDAVVIEIPKGGYSARFNAVAYGNGEGPPTIDPAPVSPTSTEEPSRLGAEPTRRSVASRELLAWALAGLFGLVALIVALAPRSSAVGMLPSTPVRFHLYPPADVRVGDLRHFGPAVISPDGRRLAFVGIDPQSQPRLWVRALDELSATSVPGTEGAAYPFWSSDSAHLAFFAGGKLKRVGIAGSVPHVLADAPIGRGGTWSTRGPIVFVPSPIAPMTILRDDGHTQARLVRAPKDVEGIDRGLHPAVLPDGHRYLFIGAGPTARNGVPYVGDLLTDADPRRYAPIAETHSNVMYAASGDASELGYLMYVRASALMALPVDAATLEARGEARLVVNGVRSSLERWWGDFSASLNGVLVYRATNPQDQRLAWYDRQGQLLEDVLGAGSHRDVTLAPDRTQLAVLRFESPVISDIWIRDLARGVESRLTGGDRTHYTPVWSADGQGLYFVRFDADGFALYHRAFADGVARKLLPAQRDFMAVGDSSADGQRVVYQIRHPSGHFDIWVLDLTSAPRASPLLQTPADEVEAQLSPDDRWLAYVSTESSRAEVYICSLANPGARVQVSADGGVQPRWRGDGRELFYVGLDGRLMSVAIGTGSPPRLGKAVALFRTHINMMTRDALQHFRFDVSLDGRRIITLAAPEPETATPWTVVTNWTAGLR